MHMYLKLTLIVLLLLVLDGIWISINMERYKKLVYNVQKSHMQVKVYGAICAYALMICGFLFFIVPRIMALDGGKGGGRKSLMKSVVFALRHGALFGCVVYGIFNATNYAIFRDYNVHMALLDTLWGTTVYFLVTLVGVYFIW